MAVHEMLMSDSVLADPVQRYPYAWGYLSSQVASFLDGRSTREQLAAVNTALAFKITEQEADL